MVMFLAVVWLMRSGRSKDGKLLLKATMSLDPPCEVTLMMNMNFTLGAYHYH